MGELVDRPADDGGNSGSRASGATPVGVVSISGDATA